MGVSVTSPSTREFAVSLNSSIKNTHILYFFVKDWHLIVFGGLCVCVTSLGTVHLHLVSTGDVGCGRVEHALHETCLL